MTHLPTNPSEATKRRNPWLFQSLKNFVKHGYPMTNEEAERFGGNQTKERHLHDDIERLCKSRGWLYVHSRMDRKTTVQVGTPDFIIALPGGKTLWIECKRPGGKLTEQQHGTLRWLRKLGHEAHVVTDVEHVNALAEGDCKGGGE